MLAIFVQLHADVRRLLTLPPGRIPADAQGPLRRRPARRSATPAVAIADEASFEAMVRSMFTQRRKTLPNALKPFAEARGVDARAALAAAGIDGSRRPETLQLAELARLADVFRFVVVTRAVL